MRKIIKTAFITTIPVLCGYISTGIAFGLMLQRAGYGVLWAAASGILIYAGSMQFVLVSLLRTAAGLPYAAMMTLAVNSRHLFYGLSFIERFRRMGKKRLYMIFSLTDETYSMLCSVKAPEGMDENTFFFVVALMNHLYCITGSVLGALAGEMIKFNIAGIDFAMTAFFIVVFIEQWISSKNRLPAITGLISSAACLLIFGPGRFILPALAASAAVIFICGGGMKKAESGEAIE